ncbi:MAG TPA: SOS response-associated peptidase [Fimbriimonadaceae bacterium]|nr:SOS response-associated peptidase [Fimbriimonadaceae bacterium]HRJ97342.1 SOS response-associated peptidase [Fimbriimonadaceae bacterium]
MCARFSLVADGQAIASFFDLDQEIDWEPHYNIAPTEDAPAVALDKDGRRVFGTFRWGLVPFWAKDTSGGPRMINARSETVAEKRAFREPFAHRRCLIAASAFYEWKTEGKTKQPYAIGRRDGRLLALAGIWDRWKQDDLVLRTCAILTTEANAAVAEIHDRMPVILDPEQFDAWLDRSTPLDELTALLTPYDDEAVILRAVDPRVGNPRFKDVIQVL